jgi:hypothetical protein
MHCASIAVVPTRSFSSLISRHGKFSEEEEAQRLGDALLVDVAMRLTGSTWFGGILASARRVGAKATWSLGIQSPGITND